MNEIMQPATQPATKPHPHGPGRPFQKGASGNPTGATESKIKQTIRSRVTASLGHEPTDIEIVAIDAIVEQLYRAQRAKDHAESARCSRTAQMWLRDLHKRGAALQVAQKPLRERWAEEAGHE